MLRALSVCLLLVLLASCGPPPATDSSDAAEPPAGPEPERLDTPKPPTAVAIHSDDVPQRTESMEPEVLPELPGEEVVTGRVYHGETRLKVSMYGVSFNLPAGLATGIAEGSPAFQVESQGKLALGFIVMKREVNAPEVKAEMGQAQDFGDGIVLALQGAVTEGNGTLSAWYGDGRFVARCVTRMGEHGNGVAFLLGAEAHERDWVERNVKALMDSVQLEAPQESHNEQRWKQLLTGHKLTYLRSHFDSNFSGSTSSSTREEISLWADGSFYYYFRDTFTITGGVGTGIGNTPIEDRGTWSIESIGAAAQLVLKGAKDRYYTLAYAEEKLFLNGKRYFRTPLQ